ncbi:mevalonate kinase [Neptuniibacter sp. QD29_5]|uniref:mevalonate kinase family protein n=1 Tax=Neptuniibacter sp. QD29_5 TaxID=3398207 RepID=UPI0039F548CC
MKAIAPGKLILSGEHSVVYGAPAIAMAVTSTVTASYTPTESPKLSISSDAFGGFSKNIATFKFFSEQLDQRFNLFLQRKLAVSDVLTSPSDLLFYTLSQLGFDRAGQISIASDIPAGAGMGSSAAVIAALLKLAEAFSQQELNKQEFFKLVRYCERLQHGCGSAIDAAATTFGGVAKVQNDHVTLLPEYIGDNWFIWNSGTPKSSTGETVSAVRESFEFSTIWQHFEQVTQGFEQILPSTDDQQKLALIQENQRLLQQIGIVPQAVADVIQCIELMGGSAKVCGAGSSSGDAGGLVLIYAPKGNAAEIANSLNIHLQPLKISYQGAHIESD